jgi:T5SS/PEP-CTERM-associated repeat protein
MITKSPGIHGYILPFLLAAPLTALAVTDTWDGGGLNDIILTSANWQDNTAPLSDINNTDLIFAGVIRPTPIFSSPFSARSVILNNGAGGFTLLGAQFDVGIGGVSGSIVNFSTNTLTFACPVYFPAAGTRIVHAFNGDLTFANTVSLDPATSMSVRGTETTSFQNIIGTGSITRDDGGTMIWTPDAAAGSDVLVFNGSLTMGADGSTDVFLNTASINVDDAGTFNINENLTLDGASLARTLFGTINVAAGKTLTVQSGADVTIAGSYTTSNSSTITLTGADSTFSTTGVTSSLYIANNSTFNVLAGADLNCPFSLVAAGVFNSNGTALVDGIGSTLAAQNLVAGASPGSNGTITFRNGCSGTVLQLGVSSDGATGALNIQTGATLTTLVLSIAVQGAIGGSGTLTINGSNSTLTVSGATTIGAGSGSTGTLNIQNGGTFNSGTDDTTVNPTGTIAISGGAYHSNGNLVINGGQLTRNASGVLDMGANSLSAQSGGDVSLTGSYTALHHISVSGAGSTFSTTGDFSVGPNVPGSLAEVDFTNGSTGAMGVITVGNGDVSIESGSSVTGSGINIASTAAPISASVIITGDDSHLTISGAGNANIGAAAGSTASLNVLSGALFTSGTGTTTVNATGSISISAGFYQSNGNLTVNGGVLTRAAVGTLQLAAGQTLTVQAGGDAIMSGPFTDGTASTITVTGAGSNFQTTSTLSFNSGSTLNVLNGGAVSTGSAQIRAGYSGNGTIVVDGAGASLSGGSLSIAQGLNNTGSVTFRNGSTGTFLGPVSVDFSGNSGTNGTLNIQSGAAVTSTVLLIAVSQAANSGTVTITGAGSTLSISGHSDIGAASSSTATVNVSNSGTLNCGTEFTLYATGTLNINGGIVNLSGPLVRNGGTINFNAGELHIVDDFSVGASGLLGSGVVFDATRQFSTTGKTTIDPAAVLTFHGGTFSAAALTNFGDLNFSNGDTDIHGDVTFTSGSHVTISGANSVTTFFDDVTHNASEVLVGAGASAVFNEVQQGSGSFTGPGTVQFNGTHSPGASAALVSFGGDVIYAPSATLQLELGGLVRGTGYDALDVTGNLTLDGTLNIVLIKNLRPAPGNTFNLFNWGTVSGAFDTINLPLLGGDLGWNTSQLYVDGTIAVIPEPQCTALLIAATLGLMRKKSRSNFRHLPCDSSD